MFLGNLERLQRQCEEFSQTKISCSMWRNFVTVFSIIGENDSFVIVFATIE